MEAHRGPRASRSKKNLPAAFQGPVKANQRHERHASPAESFAAGAVTYGAHSPRVPYETRLGDGESPDAREQREQREHHDAAIATIRLNSLVFLSSCPQRHGHFAIKKMLHPSTLELFCLMEIPGSEHQRAHLRSWLHAWLSRWSRLQSQHPGLLVALREAFWDAPQGYPMAILCEYMPLGSLHDLIQACGGLPEEAMREIALSVLQALDVLHSAEPPVVHGCVKPSQVLFSTSGRPRLTFGLEQRIKTCQVAASHEFPPEGVEQTVVDIFDLGLLLLVSALGGMEVLLDAIPYARSYGSQAMENLVSPRGDTRELLLHELRGATPEAPAEIGYLPPASDLLFNRRYSGPFLAFVSTCLEAHSQNPPVRAADLLCHEFLQSPAESEGPLVTLREMQSLARILNEAPEDPSRSSKRSGCHGMGMGPNVAPSVAQSAQLYLMNIAQSIAAYCNFVSPATPRGRRTLDTRGKEWETLLTDTARTLGLSRAVVHAALEAQVERILTGR
eukprot:s1854_g17.t1